MDSPAKMADIDKTLVLISNQTELCEFKQIEYNMFL